MGDFGVKADGLGKRFRITTANAARRWPLRARREPFWALRDVSFEVPRGSTLGIIGRNGAGKTTLLKVLSRVTPPTEGRAVLGGTASALLEVGTGFHQELTGRENVYLNGAILGMRRREIARKFDEIVEFSEIGQFIDTPVKRYSSGMNLRLAFAVAAHLEPDVLLVDEVLAVGDAAFQKKCLGKIDEVTGEGRTVVLVSHNMPTIASLADRCIWIDRGHVAEEGTPAEVIAAYLASASVDGAGEASDLSEHGRAQYLHRHVEFKAVRLRNGEGKVLRQFEEGEPVEVEVDLEVHVPVPLLELRAYVRTIEGFWLFTALSGRRPVELRPGPHRASTRIDPNYLSPGVFRIDLSAGSGSPQDFVEDAVRFEIVHSTQGYDDPTLRADVGRLRFPFAWTDVEPTDAGTA
jgi:lipopolysaccharide transport system ATP-binding protein